jgi:lipoprotein-anchoring transpeptidase ErfK/SrfK
MSEQTTQDGTSPMDTGTTPATPPPPAVPARVPPHLLFALLGLGAVVVAALALAWLGGYGYLPAADVAPSVNAKLPAKTDLKQVERKMAALQPRDVYIVVDASQNRLRLMKNDQVLREAVVSAGTGAVLKDEKSGRTWVFETPRGVRVVRSKKQHPCWTRPDWDYVENGEPLPKNWRDRIDCAALGDYAMYLGDGYMIHGTLYERSLGLSVTHGCVRVGAEDLEAVFKAASVGTKVYLY